VLILRDVLAFPAADVAMMLDTSVAAVKSTLQRARARLREVGAELGSADAPTDDAARTLLEQYVAGFENADVSMLERALRVDAALEVVPSRTWFAGRATCVPHLARFLGSPGDWRMVPVRANGQPAVGAYLRGSDGVHTAFGIAVLTVATSGIARITVFIGADLVAAFGGPETLDGG
jgi:RNA polymerase sigma-70 factor (ECF subfamily)